ncbi:hypothetical protein Rsub_06172 [Raphidocelis subcapitata]|uniref:FGFR1 oncogene partner (FOP) N-terminal dimerisation domain-containing protein n=1 Tax=Raphidocelis subcapitata TaxID=307507 RepID=A0A2V0P7S0_9CHLO|nr:hypothetical protein Rsub_06172 [Raphidocelis subcapitata]|eukprot:GBF93923.1 hypothetical protein Rsub_06172 [Raphidocelis subcapitata]
MEELKEIITCSLDQRGVLSRLKAELRANIFLAVDEQDRRQSDKGIAARGDSRKRDALSSTREGLLLLDLVQEFLAWADLRFTAKVFEAEASCEGAPPQRQRLAEELGLSGADDGGEAPLLLRVLAHTLVARDLARSFPADPAAPWHPARGSDDSYGGGHPSQRAGPLAGAPLPSGELAAGGAAGAGAGRQAVGGDVSLLRLISGATLPPGVHSFEEAARPGSQEPHAGHDSESPGGEEPALVSWRQHGPLPAAGSDGEGPGGSPAASAELPLLPGLNAAPPVETDGSEAGGGSGEERSDSGGSERGAGNESGGDGDEGRSAGSVATHRLLSPGASIVSAPSPFPGSAGFGSAPSSDAGSPARPRLFGRLAPLPAARPLPGGGAGAAAGKEEGGEDPAPLDLRRFRGAAAAERFQQPPPPQQQQQQQQQQPVRRAEAAAPESADEGFDSEDDGGTASADAWSPPQPWPRAAAAAAWGDGGAGASPAAPRPAGAWAGGDGASPASAASQPTGVRPGAAYAIEELLDDGGDTEDLPDELPTGSPGPDASGDESSQLFVAPERAAAAGGAWGGSPGSVGLQSPGASSEEGAATLRRPPPALGEDGSDGF